MERVFAIGYDKRKGMLMGNGITNKNKNKTKGSNRADKTQVAGKAVIKTIGEAGMKTSGKAARKTMAKAPGQAAGRTAAKTSKKTMTVAGVYIGNQRGFGFVSVDGMDNDIFIPGGKSNGALNGDTVEVEILRLPDALGVGADGHTDGGVKRLVAAGKGSAPAAVLHATGKGPVTAAVLRATGKGPVAASAPGATGKGPGMATAPAAVGKKTEGTVVRVVEHANRQIVGTYQKVNGVGRVVPDNPKIGMDAQVTQGKTLGAKPGQKVVLEVTRFGDGHKPPVGQVVEVLGAAGDPHVDILSLARSFGLPDDFSPEVLSQADAAPQTVSRKDIAKRLDLRKTLTVTIDGEDAKDLDDAITLTKEGQNYQLGVHIADVSHYVPEGSALDMEARKRGTSVYLIDRVIPMLPVPLSNGICSLNEGVDRLALSCLMEIGPDGEVLSSRIAETVIRSDARMTYTGVNAALHADAVRGELRGIKIGTGKGGRPGSTKTGTDARADGDSRADGGSRAEAASAAGLYAGSSANVGSRADDSPSAGPTIGLGAGPNAGPTAAPNTYAATHGAKTLSESAARDDTVSEKASKRGMKGRTAKDEKKFTEMFALMKELSNILRERRRQRGSIDFDFPESKIILSPEGEPVDIKAYERNDATRLIEDFMLAANETVAEKYHFMEIPFLYRTHDNPDPEKMQRLSLFIENFGLFIRSRQGQTHPKEIQKLLVKIEGTPEEALISRLALRSMKQAIYSPQCTGHFGLAAKYYTHFTSPIRRYPDLQIHRIIKEQLHGKLTAKRIAHYLDILPDVAATSSKTERQADEAERAVEKLKKCEYMAGRIGNYYEGVVSGVTGHGLYVELANTVEGFVHISELKDDYYVFDEERLELKGEHEKRIYALGQVVNVRVTGVDLYLKQVNFEIARARSAGKKTKAAKAKPGAGKVKATKAPSTVDVVEPETPHDDGNMAGAARAHDTGKRAKDAKAKPGAGKVKGTKAPSTVDVVEPETPHDDGNVAGDARAHDTGKRAKAAKAKPGAGKAKATKAPSTVDVVESELPHDDGNVAGAARARDAVKKTKAAKAQTADNVGGATEGLHAVKRAKTAKAQTAKNAAKAPVPMDGGKGNGKRKLQTRGKQQKSVL
jgi:exoribonuclease R